MHTIQDKAMLAKLSIGMPGNTRQDKKLTEEVKLARALGEKSGRWMKQLYPEEALEPFKALESECRQWHYEHSLPWTDEGWRIITGAIYMEYTAFMRERRSQYLGLVQSHFTPRYPDFIAWAQREQNGTFDPMNYPDVERVTRKFGFVMEFKPIPDGQDFRVSLQADEVNAIRDSINEATTHAIEQAQTDLWRRLMEPIKHMAERLSDPEATFRDSLVKNISKIVELIPALDLKGDRELDLLRREVEAELTRYHPQLLRDDKVARATTAEKAKALLARMEGYVG